MSHEPWPEWSGLNQPFDQSLPLDQYVDSALNVMRRVWRDDTYKSPTHLARLITGSDCILVIGALQAQREELRSRSSMEEQGTVDAQDVGSVPTVTATVQDAASTLEYYLGCVPLNDQNLTQAMRTVVDHINGSLAQ